MNLTPYSGMAGESLALVDVYYDFRFWILQQQQVNEGEIEQARCYWLAKAKICPLPPYCRWPVSQLLSVKYAPPVTG